MSNAAPTSDKISETDRIIYVQSRRVACDGGIGALGHPRVWMDMGQESRAECKYCDQVFVLNPKVNPDYY